MNGGGRTTSLRSLSTRKDEDCVMAVDSTIDKTQGYVGLEHALTDSQSPVQLLSETVVHGTRRIARNVQRVARETKCKSDSGSSALSSKLSKEYRSTVGFYKSNWIILQREILCGFAVTLLQIPETIAFSYVANLDPVVGLYATGFLGIIIGLFGGVPATVAGAAGALAVVMPELTGSSGSLSALPLSERIDHLFVAITLVGIMQLLFGLLGLPKFVSMIPRTAHIGFLNGLALMMFFSQMTTFKICKDPSILFGQCEADGNLAWMSASDATTWTTVGTVLATMLIMHFFPKLPVVGRVVPPTLVVALVGAGFEFGINRPYMHYDVRTIGDTSKLKGGLPSFGIPDFGGVTNWSAVASCAASLAAVGLFESIMTCQAVVDLTKRPRLTPEMCRKECMAQGVGNIVCGLFSAMGGCAMIAQSTGNVLNGGRYRLSSVVGGLTTFAVVLWASSLIEKVPVACLTGILFVIIMHTFYWPSLKLIFRLQLADAFTIVLVTMLAALMNLAIAVIAGVIWQSLVSGWRSGKTLSFFTSTEVAQVVYDDAAHEGDHGDLLTSVHVTQEQCKVYHLRGPLQFSSIATFRTFFDVENDPALVILDCEHCSFSDFSAVAGLREIAFRYRDTGKTLVARRLCAKSLDLLYHDLGWSHSEQIHMGGATTNDATLLSNVLERSSHSHLPYVVSPSAPYHSLAD